MMVYLILLLVGFLGGSIGSVAGLGGGIVIVPSLLFLEDQLGVISGMGAQVIVGTSYLVLIATGLSSTLAYIKQRKIDLKSGAIFFLGSGPGAIVGAIINTYVETEFFAKIFGVLMIVIALVLIFTRNIKPIGIMKKGKKRIYTDNFGKEWPYRLSYPLAIGISFFIGILSGLFGIGGGSLMVPMMLILFAFPPAIVIPTSMFIVFLSAVTGSITHISLGNVNWYYALFLVPGAWFGAKFGAYLNYRLTTNVVLIIFRVLLLVVGVRMVVG